MLLWSVHGNWIGIVPFGPLALYSFAPYFGMHMVGMNNVTVAAV